jgi:fido (protein-threonine AMPylation protein)
LRERFLPERSATAPLSQEEQHLQNLLNDFGIRPHVAPKRGLRLIFQRWRTLLGGLVEIGDSIEKRVTSTDAAIGDLLYPRVKLVHNLLFHDILENAGEYRSSSDPKNGLVLFGGLRPQRREYRYKGDPPSEIESGLEEAFSHLRHFPSGDKSEVVRSMASFYAKFVNVHPFYDANGRIARFVSTVYLYVNGYYIDWERVHKKKSDFLKRLNRYHDACKGVNLDLQESTLSIFVSFLEQRIVDRDDLTEEPDADDR